MPHPQQSGSLDHSWSWRLSSDITSALCASTVIAPVVTVIDKSIIQSTHAASSLRTILLSSLRDSLRRPDRLIFSRPYALITVLYFATYATANLTDSLTAYARHAPAHTVTAGAAKFVATSSVNMSICLYKDAQFARMFGRGGGSGLQRRMVPRTAMALFALRDSMTIFTSFNVPPVLGPLLGSQSAAQFLAPAGVQLLSTPLHLLGLDLFNRPDGKVAGVARVSWADRWQMVKSGWLGASMARMGRIIPAYGVGGVVNAKVRKVMLT